MQSEEAIKRNRDSLLDGLGAAGAVRASVYYEGSGDSGDITSVSIVDAEGLACSSEVCVLMQIQSAAWRDGIHVALREARLVPLEDALRDYSFEVLEHLHGGWEINDGGSGEFLFDVAQNLVSLEHREYFTESVLTETEL